jgi:hypothetical protein
VALGCGLFVVFLLAQRVVRSRSEKPLDTTGWQLADFLEHLQQREVKLQVAWGPRSSKGLYKHQLYLTEDPDATWSALQHKVVNVQCIGQWHGTVWVGYPQPWTDVEDLLYQWGECGCRIGNFLLFGDDRILRRIQEACR